MKFETLKHYFSSLLLLSCVLLVTSGANGSSWSSNYQSYTSQKDVNVKQPVDNFVDASKNTVDGQVADSRVSNNAENGGAGAGAGAGQSMYYYEMYPTTNSGGGGGSGGGQVQQPQSPPPQPILQHASQGRQLCSYTESGVMRCQPKSAAFYPTYEVSASNNIPSHSYGRPSNNRQSFDFGGLTGGGSGGHGGEGGGHGGGGGGGGGYGGGGDGWGMDMEGMTGDAGGGLGSLGSLVGAVGLLGLKGLKGLKPLLPLILAIPFLPILLPIILLPLLLPLLLLLLFIPIPVIVVPPAPPVVKRAGVSGGLAEFSERALRMGILLPEMAAEVLQSDECVERISCEVARVSRTFHVEGWMDRLTSALPKENKYAKKILQGISPDKKSSAAQATATSVRKTSEDGGDCSVFICNAKSALTKQLTKI